MGICRFWARQHASGAERTVDAKPVFPAGRRLVLWVLLAAVGFSLLIVSGCAQRIAPEVRVAGSEVVIDFQSLGEYPTSVHRLRLTESATGVVVWEVAAKKAPKGSSTPQLWTLTLVIGVNASQIEEALAGRYEVLAPLGQPGFRLEADREYRLEVWASETGRPSRASFTLRGASAATEVWRRSQPGG